MNDLLAPHLLHSEAASAEACWRDDRGAAARQLHALAPALGRRSLDVAAAFSGTEQRRLSPAGLAALVHRLTPSCTAREVRLLLAAVHEQAQAAGPLLVGSSASRVGFTLPVVKSALAAVAEAQAYPVSSAPRRARARGYSPAHHVRGSSLACPS